MDCKLFVTNETNVEPKHIDPPKFKMSPAISSMLRAELQKEFKRERFFRVWSKNNTDALTPGHADYTVQS